MRGRGMFVRFLEYVSIRLSLAGSGFAWRHAGRDASRSLNEKSDIATENTKPQPWRCQIGVRSSTWTTRRRARLHLHAADSQDAMHAWMQPAHQT